MTICDKCQKDIQPETEPETEEVKQEPTTNKSRGRPMLFKTKEERVARKSEYNKRYYEKMKLRLKTEIERDEKDT